LRDEELPGPDRLPDLITQFERDSGVPCRLTVQGDRREPDAHVRLALYRAAQEALTNVRKHAHPQQVKVSLAYEPTGIRLIVEDVSVGPPVCPPVGHAGYGLTGLRERAELVGGRWEAGPTVEGFRVELWVPA
jgi:signal transduction histidine kinase